MQYLAKIANKKKKNINYINILKSDLNLESRNSIHNYIDEFKKELIDEVNEKFDNFTKDASKKLYTKVLEKYTENISNNPNSAELKESMKSKTQLKSEATEKLTKVLKDRAIEDFLKNCTSKIYQSIVEIFKNKFNSKLDEFITNLNKNKEVNTFFESCDVLNDKKGIKLTEKIDKYIKELQIKEEKSQEKALTAQFGQSQMISSNQGESSVPLNQGGSSIPMNQGESGESGETKK